MCSKDWCQLLRLGDQFKSFRELNNEALYYFGGENANDHQRQPLSQITVCFKKFSIFVSLFLPHVSEHQFRSKTNDTQQTAQYSCPA